MVVIILLSGCSVVNSQPLPPHLNPVNGVNKLKSRIQRLRSDGNDVLIKDARLFAVSENTIKQKLDSAVWGFRNTSTGQMEYSDKIYIEYNSRGQITAVVEFGKDEFGPWNEDNKTEYSYDANGYLSDQREFDWDYDLNKWIGWNRIAYTSDASGKTTCLIRYDWNYIANDWEIDWKQETNYNQQGNIISEIYYKWDRINELWENSSKIETIDDTSNSQTINVYNWDNNSSQWNHVRKTENTYDAGENLIRSIVSYNNLETGTWNAYEKQEYAYNTDGLQTLYAEYSWDPVASQWKGESKHEASYDSKGHIMGYTWYEWNIQKGDWMPSNKITYGYSQETMTSLAFYYWVATANQWINSTKVELWVDASGNYGSMEFSSWNLIALAWEYSFKVEFTYNNAYGKSDLVFPEFIYSIEEITEIPGLDLHLANHMLIEAKFLAFENDAWEFTENAKYYYSEIEISGLEANKAGMLAVYPNPADEILHIRWSGSLKEINVKLFNHQGTLVVDKTFTDHTNIPVSGFAPGIYLYKVTQEGQPEKTGKIILQ